MLQFVNETSMGNTIEDFSEIQVYDLNRCTFQKVSQDWATRKETMLLVWNQMIRRSKF